MKIAVVIGHDKNSPGAYSSHLKISEYVYHTEVAMCLAGVADIYKRPLAKGYKTQMELLAKEINKKKYDLVVELHFNSFNGTANGCETVGFKGNAFTEKIGKQYCDVVSKYFKTNNRGHKFADVGGRGYWFLRLMSAPALILEPFFGDHPESLKFVDYNEYACVIRDWINSASK